MSRRPRALFRPTPDITDSDIARGLRWMTLEGMASHGFGALVGVGFLSAFALALGASNLQIGILAALPFLLQPLQVPTILLIERLGQRKIIAVLSFLVSQLLWAPVALIPLVLGTDSRNALPALLVIVGVRSAFATVTNCAWNSWVRDLVPTATIGQFFARRTARANLAAMGVGLVAALYVDQSHAGGIGGEAVAYSYALLAGVLTLGLAGPLSMALMPEPAIAATGERRPTLTATLRAPFRDANYRRLLRFLFLWGFALNLATPFFATYMLQRLGMPLTAVMLLTTLGQLTNVLFLRVWGRFTDAFGVKAVLSACASLYLLVIVGWTFTTMPDVYVLTLPLLVVLHALAGVAAAGVNLATSTIGMKLAPRGQGTSYLAAAALASNLGAGLGPLLGGRTADWLQQRELSFTLNWADPARTAHVPAVHLAGFDFLFVAVFVLGLLTLKVLRPLKEEGAAREEEVLAALFTHARLPSRYGGMLAQFPSAAVRRMPVPGLDVAVGVTAYQVSEVARATVSAARRGGGTAARLWGSLEDSLGEQRSVRLRIVLRTRERRRCHAEAGHSVVCDANCGMGAPPQESVGGDGAAPAALPQAVTEAQAQVLSIH